MGQKNLFDVVERIILLKCAWCILWVYLNACEQLRGCPKVAFPGDLFLIAVSLDFFRNCLSANSKNDFI